MSPQIPSPSAGTTVLTAAKFTASFHDGLLSAVHGAPQARVVQSTPSQPDKIATSDAVDATFTRAGQISGFVQQGNFQYHEGPPGGKDSRSAWAQKASYSTANEVLMLEGSPRVIDGGMTTTAQTIRINRSTGDADAQVSVKTTYSELTAQPNGALLASSDPIHVTAARMIAARSTGLAHYTGDARLWQGANIVQAPSIVFDRDKRSMDAQGASGHPVSTVFVQPAKNGSVTPVNVTAARLDYTDQQRTAHFEGRVVMRTGDGTVTADRVNVFLIPAKTSAPAKTVMLAATASQLDHILAEGHVTLVEPSRRGSGDKLVYTAADSKFVMTGGPPVIIDAEQGRVTGASLTFYNRDDRVLVEGGGTSRAVTTTRVSK